MTVYTLRDDNGDETTIDADSLKEVRAKAEEWVRDGDWNDPGVTFWVKVRIIQHSPLREWIEAQPDALDGDEVRAKFAEVFGRTPDDDDGDTSALHSHICAAAQADDDEVVDRITVAIDPQEPHCTGDAHSWQSPYELLGGQERKP